MGLFKKCFSKNGIRYMNTLLASLNGLFAHVLCKVTLHQELGCYVSSFCTWAVLVIDFDQRN